MIDLHWPFRKAIVAAVPHARIVADKFHVLRSVNGAAQKVRTRHGRKPGSERAPSAVTAGSPANTTPATTPPSIKPARSPPPRPQPHRRNRRVLHDIFALEPNIGVAWRLKEAFAEIYQATDRAEAEQRLALWIDHVHTAGLPELENAWRTLSHWTDPILNYFDDRQTNAYAEGITNKIKVLKRRGTDYRNPHRYRAKVLLICGNRPND